MCVCVCVCVCVCTNTCVNERLQVLLLSVLEVSYLY